MGAFLASKSHHVFNFFGDRFWVLFWVPFGSLLVPLGRPSWPPSGSWEPFFRKHVIFRNSSATAGRIGFVTSRGHRKRPKMGPRRSQDGLEEVLFRCWIFSSILVRFGTHFGAILGPQNGHFGDRFLLFFWTSPRGRPKSAPRGPKRLQKAPREPLWELKFAILVPKRLPRGSKRLPREPKLTPRGDRERENESETEKESETR